MLSDNDRHAIASIVNDAHEGVSYQFIGLIITDHQVEMFGTMEPPQANQFLREYVQLLDNAEAQDVQRYHIAG